jgi:hypothetical protein
MIKMTNREWLMNEIQNMSDEKLCVFDVGQMICDMLEANVCKEVHSDCELCKTNWLKLEHKEPIKLSDAERVILENIDKKYKWIARQYTGSIIVWECKPLKSDKAWLFSGGEGNTLLSFSHLFQFITWNDSEPYNIEELLK